MDRIKVFAAFLSLLVVLPFDATAQFVFSAPPRESKQKGVEQYKPITDFLTRATGEQFTYEHPTSWAGYSKNLRDGYYGINFGGPHFTSWVVEKLNYNAVLKLPQPMVWVFVTRNDDLSVDGMDDLVAKKVCFPGLPNFGSLTLLSYFPNPTQEPIQVRTKGWKNGFDSLIARKCQAAVMPQTNHRKYDPVGTLTKVIHTHKPYPNQAIAVSPRLEELRPGLQLKIQQALLSEEGQEAMSKLRQRFAAGEELVPANSDEYRGISQVLDQAIGFGEFGF